MNTVVSISIIHGCCLDFFTEKLELSWYQFRRHAGVMTICGATSDGSGGIMTILGIKSCYFNSLKSSDAYMRQ